MAEQAKKTPTMPLNLTPQQQENWGEMTPEEQAAVASFQRMLSLMPTTADRSLIAATLVLAAASGKHPPTP
jgi:hypothetical protein